MHGRAEFREVTQSCRTDKKPVLDINPKTSLSEHTLFWFTRDRAKYSHHHLLSFGCFFFLFFLSFSQNLSLLYANAHTFLSLDICGVGPCGPSPAGSPAAPCPPPPSSPWVSDRRGWQSGPQHHFLSGALPPARGSGKLFISHKDTDRDRIGGTLSVWAQMSASAADASSPCCVSPSRSLFFLPSSSPSPSSLLRSPSSHVAEDELKPGQAERGTAALHSKPFSCWGTQPRLVFLSQFRYWVAPWGCCGLGGAGGETTGPPDGSQEGSSIGKDFKEKGDGLNNRTHLCIFIY